MFSSYAAVTLVPASDIPYPNQWEVTRRIWRFQGLKCIGWTLNRPLCVAAAASAFDSTAQRAHQTYYIFLDQRMYLAVC